MQCVLWAGGNIPYGPRTLLVAYSFDQVTSVAQINERTLQYVNIFHSIRFEERGLP